MHGQNSQILSACWTKWYATLHLWKPAPTISPLGEERYNISTFATLSFFLPHPYFFSDSFLPVVSTFYRPSHHPLLDRGAPDLSRVSSVEDWLAALKMTQYRDSFLGSGFTSLPLVTQITAEYVHPFNWLSLSFLFFFFLSASPCLPASHTAHLPSLHLVSWRSGRAAGWLTAGPCVRLSVFLNNCLGLLTSILFSLSLSWYKMLWAPLLDINISLSDKVE